MPLSIKQSGYPDLNFVAKYYSEPFTAPVYWDWRVSRWHNNKSWELEAIHHKLYLQNKPAEVQQFSISHGYNIIFTNRGYSYKGLLMRLGLGFVLSHPETQIRNQNFNQNLGIAELGYYISGTALNFAIGKHFNIGDYFYINSEAKTTFSYANIPIVNGNAVLYNWAFHAVLGLGVNFGKPNK
jgi:hypothetical protein